jgi:5-deoxy-5-amino-3-dehydroquinate synthase
MNVTVDLAERSYDVVVGDGARHSLAELIARRTPHARCAAIVTSPSLATQPWFDLSCGVEQVVVLVAEGESAKTLSSYGQLLETLAEHRLSRDDVVVGVGGGAITDLAGFAAASYLRGVALVQVPTSLVAQVDAAIGGKTGVNLPAGKNLVGAFYQPQGVLCDTSVLDTLPERERRSGLGEVAKCWLLDGRDAKDLAATPLIDLIELSVRLKSSVVSNDEREGDIRALLNYGHTLAHALEAITLAENPDELRHGEAVAIGLAFAARLARALHRVGDNVVANHDAVLDALGLERRLADHFDVDELLEAMSHDKKARHDLSFVLDGPDGFSLVSGVEPSVVRATLERLKGEP